MLKLSTMKSLVTRTPCFHSYLHTERPNLLARTTLKTPNSFLPSLSLVTNCSQTTSRPSGEIHVIVGPMFAGKTTTLLKRMNLASTHGRSAIVIKSDKDTRYGLECIVTHDGEKLPCVPLADLSSFREKLGAEAYDKVDVIGIDEAQFFGDLYDFCSKAADHDGKNIIVAGLDGEVWMVII